MSTSVAMFGVLLFFSANVKPSQATLGYDLNITFDVIPQDSPLQDQLVNQAKREIKDLMSKHVGINISIQENSIVGAVFSALSKSLLVQFNPTLVEDQDVLLLQSTEALQLSSGFIINSRTAIAIVFGTQPPSPMPTPLPTRSPTTPRTLTTSMQIFVGGLTSTLRDSQALKNSVIKMVEVAPLSASSVTQVNIGAASILVFFDADNTNDDLVTSARTSLNVKHLGTMSVFECCPTLVFSFIQVVPTPTTCSDDDGCPPGVSTTTTALPDASDSHSSSPTAGTTTGIVIAVLFVIGLIVGVGIFYFMRKKRTNNADAGNPVRQTSLQQNQGFLLSKRTTTLPEANPTIDMLINDTTPHANNNAQIVYTADPTESEAIINPMKVVYSSDPQEKEPSKKIEDLKQRLATANDLGKRVVVDGFESKGIIRFIGPVQGSGESALFGIEFDDPVGASSGAWFGVNYFTCAENRGHFVPVGNAAVFIAKRSHPKPTTSSSSTSKNEISSTADFPKGRIATLGDVGKRVVVEGYATKGLLRHAGQLKGADEGTGEWFGIMFDDALGNSDGTLNGERYFTCQSKCGLFVPVGSEKVFMAKRSTVVGHKARSQTISGTRPSTANDQPNKLFGAQLLAQDPVDYDESRKQRARQRSGSVKGFAGFETDKAATIADFPGFDHDRQEVEISERPPSNTDSSSHGVGIDGFGDDETSEAHYMNTRELNLPAEDTDAEYTNLQHLQHLQHLQQNNEVQTDTPTQHTPTQDESNNTAVELPEEEEEDDAEYTSLHHLKLGTHADVEDKSNDKPNNKPNDKPNDEANDKQNDEANDKQNSTIQPQALQQRDTESPHTNQKNIKLLQRVNPEEYTAIRSLDDGTANTNTNAIAGSGGGGASLDVVDGGFGDVDEEALYENITSA